MREARSIVPITVAILMGVLSSCSINSNYFAEDTLSYRNSKAHSFSLGESTISYLEEREQTLKSDPSRGIGLKDSADLGGGAASIPADSRFRVFLFMGQSNMVGYGKGSKLTQPYNEIHPRIRIWSKNEWQYLVPRGSFGPEVAFAHYLSKQYPDDTIGIIKIAVSGTGMNAWKPDWEWSAASKTGDALKGSLYRDMINAVIGARKETCFQFEGFFWKQGGRDGRKADLADTYQERFVDLVNHLRNDLGAPDLPVFVLTYFDETGLEENRKLLEKVRPKAINLYLSKARVSDYLHNAYPVFHGRLPTRMDKIHFNTEGQLLLGEIAAKAYIQYIDRNTFPESSQSAIINPPTPDF